MNFKQRLTIHIQGLPFNISSYVEEIDEVSDIDTKDMDIKSLQIQKIGGYKPQKLELIFINDKYELEGQAFIIKYMKGSLEATPISDIVDIPKVVPPRLTNYLHSLRLYLPIELTEGWVGIYGEDGLSFSFSYSSIYRTNSYVELLSPPN